MTAATIDLHLLLEFQLRERKDTLRRLERAFAVTPGKTEPLAVQIARSKTELGLLRWLRIYLAPEQVPTAPTPAGAAAAAASTEDDRGGLDLHS